ncbi:BTB/POZ domain-containing protein At3g05675-like [Wolffia australiana]
MIAQGMKKRNRGGSSGRLSSSSSIGDLTGHAGENAIATVSAPAPGEFNDVATADVVLGLQLELDGPPSPFSRDVEGPASSPHADPVPSLELYLHSVVLRRCRYFAALLSDRWRHAEQEETTPHGKIYRFNLKVSLPSANRHRPFEAHTSVLRLLYTRDFVSSIVTVSGALEILHVALEILFDDCVRACVRFLEAVPWSEDEERMILSVIPYLPQPESADLVSRILPSTDERTSSEEMLHGLVLSAIQAHPSMPSVKAFVARLLKEFPSRDSVGRVLDRGFLANLETVKSLLAEYASPDFRTAGDNDETEAIQRLNLHAALVSTRKLLWLIERMIDMKVADNAVREWSEQTALAVDLQKAFKDEAWRNIAPGLPAYVMRCTSRLANAVAAGSILSDRQVRMRLVKNWLPVLNVCRDVVSPMHSGQKLLQQELEETFLRIISTLPLSDSQDLLQQCLWFSTRNADCPHLISAFNTWFRRANRHQGEENGS